MKNLKNHHLCRFSYTDFQSILQPEDNGNQNPNESYTNKYRDYIWSYVNKVSHTLVKKQFTILLKVWSKKINIVVMWWKNIFTGNLKKLMKILKNLLNVGSLTILILMVKSSLTYQSKIQGSAHCNVNVKLNHKVPVVFHNLKKLD